MRDRARLWYAGLIVVAVASTAAALGLIWWASELQVQVYAFYRDNPQVIASDVPVTKKVAEQALSLPVHPKLTDADLETIVSSVREVFGA